MINKFCSPDFSIFRGSKGQKIKMAQKREIARHQNWFLARKLELRQLTAEENKINLGMNNSYRISAVADRLYLHVQPGRQSEPVEFFNLCLSLSRYIDFSLSNNNVPRNAQDLPKLLKLICQQKNQHFLQAAVKVLMTSVKHACNYEWFHPKDSEDLLTLFNEMGKDFCTTVDVDVRLSHHQSTISTIMERFYPKLKMGQILASLEIKPGYGAFLTDFNITKNTVHSQPDKIWLFVAQIDNIETSACLITPQNVSFTLNGKGVDKRTNALMDPGPQMPTIVTGMLEYGPNLLQVIGQFNGHYLILVAFMSHKSLPENPVLPDYVQPPATSFDSDSDVIEGPSKISLNCPISFTRLKIPVKGRSCKHFQCFDFDNFIKINSRRPSWLCPHCNQYVCHADICLDWHMVEVLKSVGDNVSEVVISANGSWKAIYKDDNDVNKMQNDVYNSGKESAEQEESSCFPRNLSNVVDLTNDDDNMELLGASETTDKKPHPADLQSQSTTPNLTSLGSNYAVVNQDVAAQVEDDFRFGVQVAFGGSDTPNYLNSVVNECGRSQSIPIHVNRSPVAVQALPTQSQALGPHQRSRANLSPVSCTVAHHVSVSSPASCFSPILSDTERQQHFSRSIMNLPRIVGATEPVSQHHSITQSQAPQMPNASAPSQRPNSYNTSFLYEFQNAHLQQALNPRGQSIGQSSSAVLSSRSQTPWGGLRSSIVHAAGTPANGQPTRDMNAGRVARQPAQAAGIQANGQPTMDMNAGRVARQPVPLPIQNQTPREHGGNVRGPLQSTSRLDGSFNLHSESDWRPTGRMRGSLDNQQFSDAVRRLIIKPTQSAQSARPRGSQSAQPNNDLQDPSSVK